ncbi:MAG: glycosyltransferase family 2 protein [Marinosulfonomonas sp.]
MTSTFIELEFSPFVMDFSHPALIRDRLGAPDDRDKSYDDRYDFSTLFYDCYFDQSSNEIILVAPQLLNFRRLIEEARFQADGVAVSLKSINDISRGAVISFDAPHPDPKEFSFEHAHFSGQVKIRRPQTELFAGKNALYAISKNNRLEWIKDWLTYYVRAHQANAVVLYDNNSTDYGFDDLRETVMSVPGIETAAIGRAYFPFGPSGESKTDFSSLFLQRTMTEIGRRRLLSNARAVLNVDIDELMYSHSGTSIFDATVNSKDGYTRANAEWVYAEPNPDGSPPRFFNHRFVSQNGRPKSNRKWCVAPNGPQKGKQWLTHFLGGRSDPVDPDFWMWHFSQISTSWKYQRDDAVLPKLKEDPTLIAEMQRVFPDVGFVPDPSPVAAPVAKTRAPRPRNNMLVVTAMKNEGPYILEWIAYHRLIGFNQFLVYTNDCSDGTDDILDRMHEMSLLIHERNIVLRRGPQKSALKAAKAHPITQTADWVYVADIDEFLNIKIGDGHVNDLLDALPNADVIPVTWRLFSHDDKTEFVDELVIDQFKDAELGLDKGGQRGRFVKSLFRNEDTIQRFGTHGPILANGDQTSINWITPDGRLLTEKDNLTQPRRKFGYEVAQINHYATRSIDGYLVKKDRGRVNHFNQAMGLEYWEKMCRGGEADLTIQRHSAALQNEVAKLMEDPQLNKLHKESVKWHHNRIEEVLGQDIYFDLRKELVERGAT